jgi:hypothetical protein
MAGVKAHVTSGEVTLVANTAKSCLQIKAAANQRVIVEALRITGKQPAGGTDTPVKIRMTRSTANFGTFSSATVGKNDPTDSETLQTTYGANASVEPTAPTDGSLWWEVQPQSGLIEFYPPDMRIEVPGGQSVQFEATSNATPIITMTATTEE